jgi:predicted transcriptional regulator
LDHATEQYSLVQKITGAITDNELSSQSKNTYTSDQLAHIIKQKYFPLASNDQVNSVLKHLAEDHTNVASQTTYPSQIDKSQHIKVAPITIIYMV